MNFQRLTCPSGHGWDHPVDGPLPADLRIICPVCIGAPMRSLRAPATTPATEPAATTDAAAGLSFDGFEILEVLNRGGMGVVYKARQLGLNRLVALKVIAPERIGHAQTLKRFQREVQAAALLSHPNIVAVYHTDLNHRHPFLAMEYLDGIDLSKLVQQAGPLAEVDACNYVLQTARGLQHAFERGLVHRDIKPANLMVTPSPLNKTPHGAAERRVKILDMGLARIVDPLEGGDLTQADMFLGTPDYSSPEQAEDSRKADIRSDLYSLGGTLYFLLTGEAPFPHCSIIEKYRRQLTQSAPSLAARRPDVWPVLDAVVKLLMARDPAHRFQTPAELIETLENALRDPNTPLGRAAHADPAAAIAQVTAHVNGVTSLAVSADGQWLISGGLDETLRTWDAERLLELRCISNDVGSVGQISLAPGSKWAASCSLRLFAQDMVVQIWDLADGTSRRRLRGATDNLRCVAISPDGRRVAAGGADPIVRVWSVDQPKSPCVELKGHTDHVNAVVFLSGGSVLLSAGNDRSVRLWNPVTGVQRATLNAEVGRVSAVAYNASSRRLGFAGEGLRVLHPDGSFTQMIGHASLVLCVAFSADGRFLASGGSDQTVRVWRAEDGKELRCFKGHTGKVCTVAFRPDGKAIYSGSADATIRYWPGLA